MVSEYFESRKQSAQKQEKSELAGLVNDMPETEMLFYKDTRQSEAEAKIIKELDYKGKKFIILDKTLFYPTMGGQAHDVGEIDGRKIINVLKVGSVILHEVKN
jgi:alanyl-tRNA synthetase